MTRAPDEHRDGPVGGAVSRQTRDIVVHGLVQGVGFRPFVYRLAQGLALDGTVRNTAGRVEIRASGSAEDLDEFVRRLASDAPPRSRVEGVTAQPALPTIAAGSGFGSRRASPVRRRSASSRPTSPPVTRASQSCTDPADRRYRYPFINCTDCGPRATIIEELPYDRAQTSMRDFPLCDPCRAEYRDPGDRRFHAEPVACPDLRPAAGLAPDRTRPAPTARGEDALQAAVAAIRAGQVVGREGSWRLPPGLRRDRSGRRHAAA